MRCRAATVTHLGQDPLLLATVARKRREEPRQDRDHVARHRRLSTASDGNEVDCASFREYSLSEWANTSEPGSLFEPGSRVSLRNAQRGSKFGNLVQTPNQVPKRVAPAFYRPNVAA